MERQSGDGPKDEVDMRLLCTPTQIFRAECKALLLDSLALVVGRRDLSGWFAVVKRQEQRGSIDVVANHSRLMYHYSTFAMLSMPLISSWNQTC